LKGGRAEKDETGKKAHSISGNVGDKVTGKKGGFKKFKMGEKQRRVVENLVGGVL